ncbi:MAG: 4Fe-4S binding protein [Planctomycetes bacterium]|nr:4Fe-4S binding protein [Planctomycetota bacterium]
MLRTITRCCVLVLGALLALRFAPWPWAATGLPALSPFVALCSAAAARAIGIVALLALPVLVLSIALRRGFCRYGCPMGMLLEWAGRLRRGARAPRVPRIGQWVLLITLAGSLVGYPLLLWLDPLALFHGFFGALRSPFGALALLSAIGLPAVVLLTLLWPGIWCGRLCPLGAAQDLLDMARQPSTAPAGGPGVARRSVLAAGLGAAWAFATLRWARAGAPKPIRPPGALDEARFTGVCIRCGNCVRVCPTGILRHDTASVAGFLAPIAEFRSGYCREECARCGQVCPSGAIARLSLKRKRATPMGIVQVDMGLCALGNGRECSACILRCPYEAITTAFNWDDYTTTLRIDAAKCPGCGACELACPMPLKAIVVVPT